MWPHNLQKAELIFMSESPGYCSQNSEYCSDNSFLWNPLEKKLNNQNDWWDTNNKTSIPASLVLGYTAYSKTQNFYTILLVPHVTKDLSQPPGGSLTEGHPAMGPPLETSQHAPSQYSGAFQKMLN